MCVLCCVIRKENPLVILGLYLYLFGLFCLFAKQTCFRNPNEQNEPNTCQNNSLLFVLVACILCQDEIIHAIIT